MHGSTLLAISGVDKSYGHELVLNRIDLAVDHGEFVALLGPSGCGKTTLLRIVAGLVMPDRGSIALDGKVITKRPPHRRDIGVVFQNYALFPHLNVAENVAFGLKARRASAQAIEASVTQHLDIFGLTALAGRPIVQISGGQQQRVAVARALAVKPRLVLFDEPFSALDRKLRDKMQIELKQILRRMEMTAIFVTHDQEEAFAMSDRIAVMNNGRIEQVDTPAGIYRRPATAFALDFVGLSTRLAGTVEAVLSGGTIRVATAAGPVLARGGFTAGSSVTIGIRPEQIRLGGSTGQNSLTANLQDSVFQGSKVLHHFEAAGGDRIVVEALDNGPAPVKGEATLLSWNFDATLVYPRQSP